MECEDEDGTYCPLCGTCHENADNLTKHMWTNHAELMGPKKRGRPKKLLTSVRYPFISIFVYNNRYIAISQ